MTEFYFAIFKSFFFYLVCVVWIILYIIKVIKKKTLFIWEPTTYIMINYPKQAKIGASFVLLFLLVGFVWASSGVLPEVPRILSGNYRTTECTIKINEEDSKMYCKIDGLNIKVISKTLLKPNTKVRLNYYEGTVLTGYVDEILD